MNYKLIINELLNKFPVAIAEKNIILSFILSNNINYLQSPILKNYFENFTIDNYISSIATSLKINNIKQLDNCLELIIPIEDRKYNGAFFTPDFIINYIINEIHPEEHHKNLDPSCGCGAFLVGLTDYYFRNFKKSIKNIIKENIYGSDILDYNIRRAKIILSIYALQKGEIVEEDDFNLWHQDSLRTIWPMKFDNMVGNPPYVKFQDLSDENRQYLFNQWTTAKGGTFNLYFAFFELGYNLLESTGRIGFITPNNYFTSLSGESLRKYFQEKKCITKIIDFNHKKVFEAQTYTAITFLNKNYNEYILYDRIGEKQTPEQFLINTCPSKNNLNDLNMKKWRLLKADDQDNIKIIESIGTPIGKLFDICVGIATLKDNIYFIDGSSVEKDYCLKVTKNGTYKIEKAITRVVYKISDFKNQEDIKNNTRRIIFPYAIKNRVASLIEEKIFKEKFPQCYLYLVSEKEQLLARDKGKIKYEPFYAWGRTQGLTKVGKKILNPTFSQYPRFFIVEDEQAFFTNGYGIYYKDDSSSESLFSEIVNPISKIDNMDVLQKFLNSYVMHYYISKTSVSIEGGYPCYQKNFIERFTIPELTNNEIEILRNLNNQKSISEFLIEKYHLNLSMPNLSV